MIPILLKGASLPPHMLRTSSGTGGTKVTRGLVDTHGAIVLEDLSLEFMRQDNLAHAAHDAGLGMFRQMLAYKAIETGCEWWVVDPRYTTANGVRAAVCLSAHMGD